MKGQAESQRRGWQRFAAVMGLIVWGLAARGWADVQTTPPAAGNGAVVPPPLHLIEGDDPLPGTTGADSDDRICKLLAHPGLEKALTLIPPQSEAIGKQLTDYRKKSGDLRQALDKAGLEQARLLSLPKTDEKAILQAIKTIGDLRTRMAQLQMQQLLFLRRTLNPAQIEKLQAFIEQELAPKKAAAKNKPNKARP